jgi:hypothetical protein
LIWNRPHGVECWLLSSAPKVRLIAVAFAQVPSAGFLRAMHTLDAERRKELEPKLRIALGQIHVNAMEARVAPRGSDDGSIF